MGEPYADILVDSGLNRALAIHAEMIPILSAFIQVLSAFISVPLRFFDWPNHRRRLSTRCLRGVAHQAAPGAGWQPNATRFSHNRTACKNCGADPRSAAGPLAGLAVVDETDPVGEERVQGGNLLLWHLLRAVALPKGDPRGPGVRPTIFAEFSELENSGVRL